MKEFLKNLLVALPGKPVIIFESAPVYADNTRAVYDEMVRRGWHEKYDFYWYCTPNVHRPEEVPHAKYLEKDAKGLWQKLKLKYLLIRASALISCNDMLIPRRKNQYTIFLMHGASLKSVKGKYDIPDCFTDISGFSSYLAPIDEEYANVQQRLVRLLGFPRNDVLFQSRLDKHQLFPGVTFEKLAYWMPTFRQHKSGQRAVSNVAMPILYNEDIAKQVNEAAKAAGVLVVVKPHFAQDVSRITAMNLSNLIFINDAFLSDHGIINYELLGVADALLTDYSSVYYDYLLLNRTIGLCWDDYEEYKAREGFAVDMDTVMAGGEKIYTADDLCGFLARLGAGEDVLAQQRKQVLDLIHDHQDDRSAQRTVDLIEQRLAEK